MTTEQLIKTLRNSMPPGPITQGIMLDAADRLEKLERANKSTLADLALALSERTPHDYGILKEEAAFLRKERNAATVNQQLTVRPEPSRLEIAAMAMQGMLAASSYDTLRLSKSAFECADALIAAAKEGK
jgi:hypothetical protein